MGATGLRTAILVDAAGGAVALVEFELPSGELAEHLRLTEVAPAPGEISERVYQLVPSGAASEIFEYRLIRIDRAD